MAVTYMNATSEMDNLVREIVGSDHPDLEDVEILVLMRDNTQRSGGKSVWAKTSKASSKQRALAHRDVDFIIEISEPVWSGLSEFQRRALVDHELCHCGVEVDPETGEVSYSIVGHDIEEFGEIARRYGKWNDDLADFAEQLTFHGVKPLKVVEG